MTDPTTEAVDAGVIVAVLRILDRGWLEPIPDDLMDGLHVCTWNGYMTVNEGQVSKLSDAGRRMLAKLGVLYPERAA